MTKKSAGIFFILWSLSACATLPTLTNSRDPLSSTEHVTLGNTYAAKGEKALAIQQYQAAVNEDKRCAPALMALGTIAYGDQDWKNAQTYFKRALKITPGDPAAVNNLANIYLAENIRLNDARAALDQAMGIAGPLIPYLQDTLANIAIRQNRWTDAKIAIDRADATAPRNNPNFEAQLQKTRDALTAALQASPPKF